MDRSPATGALIYRQKRRESDTMLTLMLICNEAQTARSAIEAGVDRLFIDLEIHNKRERQPYGNTVISSHTLDDVAILREAMPSAELLVRINPPHTNMKAEVDEAITNGADIIMLPMFRTLNDINRLIESAAGRARLCPLVETPEALVRLPQILERAAFLSEIYIGLNDLHLGLGLRFMFECLAGGLIDHAASIIQDAGLPFGFGGIGRLGTGDIPAELVLSEHVRLGSSIVILSRTFNQGLDGSFAHEIGALRNEEARLRTEMPSTLEINRAELRRRAWDIAEARSSRQ